MRDGPQAGLDIVTAILERGILWTTTSRIRRRPTSPPARPQVEAIAAHNSAGATNQAPEHRFIERRLAELHGRMTSQSLES